MDILTKDFYDRDTLTVARDLLGRELVRVMEDGTVLRCVITETEAYIGRLDKACHAYGYKRTPRTETLFAPPGTAYIYLIYGMYCCFNVVTRPQGEPEAVLIRSAQPVAGREEMAKNRGMAGEIRERALLTGPGKLCQGMAIDRGLYGEPLWGGRLWLAQGEPVPEAETAATPRINVDYAGEAAGWPWRFVEKGSRFLSAQYRG